MKIPKTTKGYLKMLIEISEHNTNIKKSTYEEREILGKIVADIQNDLGEGECEELLKKYNLEWKA